ncbi:MAG: biotin/lipoyl-binding protein [Chloroflexi bacterium]|nr:biotin/lipoyl-binding protein [Chloroflexota bacterium]
MKIKIGDQEFDAQPTAETVTVNGESFNIRIVRHEKTLTVYVNEKPFAVQLPDPLPEDGVIDLLVDAKTYAVEASGAAAAAPRPKAARKSSAAATGAVVSQMTGRIVRIDVKTGDEVSEGDVLLVIEAMKMENEITAPVSGTIKEIDVSAGARVSDGDTLLVIEPAGD